MTPEKALNPQYTIQQEQVNLSADRPVRAQRLRVAQDVLPHDHVYHEVCIVLDGSAVHRTSHYESPLRAGSALVVPPGNVHAIAKVSGLEVINVYYLDEWLLTDLGLLWRHAGLVPLFLSASLFNKPLPAGIPQFRLEQEELDGALRELEEIEREYARPDRSPVLIRSCFLKALAWMTRAFARGGGSLKGYDFRQEVWATLNEIERLIGESEALDVEALAGSVGLSSDHLGKLFRHAAGRGVNDYYQHRRVYRACQLLLDPQHSITDVGYLLGYADTPHFCRMFKRYRGMSPRQYRKTYLPDGG